MTALRTTRAVALGLAGALTLTMMVALVASALDAGLCGKTVAADVELGRDLNCTGNGITVGASGITIDLNGHTIAGSGTGMATFGILINEKADVTIRGSGIITGFTTGITITDSSNVIVQGIDLDENGLSGLAPLRAGVRITSSTNVQLYENRIGEGNGVGLILAGTTTGGTIYDNKIKDNGVGIRFLGTGVTGNSFVANKLTKNDCGIQGSPAGNTFFDNHFSNNGVDTC